MHLPSPVAALFVIALSCAPLLAQGSDSCATAQSIVGIGAFPFDNSAATTDGLADPLCDDAGTDEITSDVWFEWTAPGSLSYTLQTCNQTGVDTRMAVYAGAGCPTGSPLECADDACGVQTSLTFDALGGASYLVRLGCFPGAPGGSGNFSITEETGADCDVPAVGPDVIVGALNGLREWGAVGSIGAYSIGTTSCNVGDQDLDWVASTSAHPVIAQSMYRLEGGRLEQIGMSWLKHGFTALQQNLCCTCTTPNGASDRLGVGCSDPYGAGLNGDQGMLGPRFEVNPATGEFPYPFSGGGGGNAIHKRLQIEASDLDPGLHPDALFFAEGQYITRDDAMAGNGDNNCSYRAVGVGSFTGGQWPLFLFGLTHRGAPAIQAWQDSIPTVRLEEARVPGDGLFLVGSHCIDHGDGTWRYEYGVFNMNSDRAAGGFSVPVPQGVALTGLGFHDVPYHSGEPFAGTDWSASTTAGSVVWATDAFSVDPDANALRWGTLYNFWFDADSPPADGQVKLVLFKPGSPVDVLADAQVPGGATAPTTYCQTSPNSAGPGALMGSAGSTSLSANCFLLEATGAIPGSFGLFFYGPDQVQAPLGNGFRCVGASSGGVHRLHPPVQADAAGTSRRGVDFTLPPAGSGSGTITPGSTWNFQLWYRDAAGGGAEFNLSDGLSATFGP